MKKLFVMMLALLLCVSSVCLADSEAVWDRNSTEHWRVGENGEKLDVGAHELNDMSMCTVCGSEIFSFYEDSIEVVNYTEYQDIARYSSYDLEGNLLDETLIEHEYDQDGRILSYQMYSNGTLFEEAYFVVNEYGELMPQSMSSYDIDGSRVISEYDEYGNIVKVVGYNGDGSVAFEEITENNYNEDGLRISAFTTNTDSDGTVTTYEFNHMGDIIVQQSHLADGTLLYHFRTDYVYTEDGNTVSVKFYENDRLASESQYCVVEDEYSSWSYEETYTEYMEDGTRIVYEYDMDGAELAITTYDADGNIVE